MPSEIQLSSRKVGFPFWSAMFRNRVSTRSHPTENTPFAEINKEGKLIPVDFLPYACSYGLPYYSSRDLKCFTGRFTNSEYVEVLTDFHKTHPVTRLNGEWWNRILNFANSSSTSYGHTAESMAAFMNQSYYETTPTYAAGLERDIRYYRPYLDVGSVIAMNDGFNLGNVSSYTNAYKSLWRVVNDDNSKRIYLSNLMVLLEQNLGTINQVLTRRLAYGIFLKSEHYHDWIDAYYHAELISYGDKRKHRRDLVNRFDGDSAVLSVAIDPKWFTLIIDEEAMEQLQADSFTSNLYSCIMSNIVNPWYAKGYDVDKVTAPTSLARHMSKISRSDNFRSHIKGDLANYEENGKTFLASLSASLQGNI